jgi:hypothetical protein
MKKRVKVKFVFEGWVEVEDVNTKPWAKDIVKGCFSVCLDTPHSSDDRIKDWDIGTHPTKVTLS